MQGADVDSESGARVIDAVPALEDWLERISSAPRIAVDIEADGMFRYRARLCTIQVAVPDEIVILDTLAVSTGAKLQALLGPDGPEKIVHDASFDARMLHAQGTPLARVFDTAVAARFLGIASTGLSSLLSARFEIALEKSHQQADWGKRPLSSAMLSYLENDVRYLGDLYLALLSDVRAQDIECEVREECAYVLSQAALTVPSLAPWMRIKGAGQLLPSQRVLLRELAEEREHVACLLDVPPGRFLSNDNLLRFVMRPEPTKAAFHELLGSRGAPHEERFGDCFERARGQRDAPTEEVNALCPPVPSLSQIEAKKRRRKALTEFRAREAAARSVDFQVVLPGHCLSDVADLPVLDAEHLLSVSGFGQCRLERYGAMLVTELGARW